MYSKSDNSCREWQGARNNKGYGSIYREGKTWGVHRWVWQLVTGEILTPDEHILHHCDNPPCFRFDHLFKGDNTANIQDRVRKGRSVNNSMKKTHCPRGHPLIIGAGHGGLKRGCPICERKRARKKYW